MHKVFILSDTKHVLFAHTFLRVAIGGKKLHRCCSILPGDGVHVLLIILGFYSTQRRAAGNVLWLAEKRPI